MLDEVFLVKGQVRNNNEFIEELMSLARRYDLQIANGRGFDLSQLDNMWTSPREEAHV